MIRETPAGRLGSDLGTRPILIPADGLTSQKLRVWGSHPWTEEPGGLQSIPWDPKELDMAERLNNNSLVGC